MEDRTGKKWSREETILAFELYCRTPFGKIGGSNTDIIRLSKIIGRTADAVALKMHNLAHFDPNLQARNVKAMGHTSKLDKIIFDEFHENLDNLAIEANIILEGYGEKSLSYWDELGEIEEIPEGEYRESVVKERVGHYYFRKAILNAYHQRCCVTGIGNTSLLMASHIKPWAACEEKGERTNPRNGLCLNPLHDKAFDRGLITITTAYKLIHSSKLKGTVMDEATREWLMKYDGRVICLPDKFKPSLDFITYHNDVVFTP